MTPSSVLWTLALRLYLYFARFMPGSFGPNTLNESRYFILPSTGFDIQNNVPGTPPPALRVNGRQRKQQYCIYYIYFVVLLKFIFRENKIQSWLIAAWRLLKNFVSVWLLLYVLWLRKAQWESSRANLYIISVAQSREGQHLKISGHNYGKHS